MSSSGKTTRQSQTRWVALFEVGAFAPHGFGRDANPVLQLEDHDLEEDKQRAIELRPYRQD